MQNPYMNIHNASLERELSYLGCLFICIKSMMYALLIPCADVVGDSLSMHFLGVEIVAFPSYEILLLVCMGDSRLGFIASIKKTPLAVSTG